MKTISERIKFYRKQSGFTQAKVADSLSMNRSTYARHEATGDFYINDLMRMADLFNTDVANLLGDIIVPPPSPIEPNRLRGPNKNPFEIEEMVPTNDELNYIKIIRSLKKKDFLFIKEFLEEHK